MNRISPVVSRILKPQAAQYTKRLSAVRSFSSHQSDPQHKQESAAVIGALAFSIGVAVGAERKEKDNPYKEYVKLKEPLMDEKSIKDILYLNGTRSEPSD